MILKCEAREPHSGRDLSFQYGPSLVFPKNTTVLQSTRQSKLMITAVKMLQGMLISGLLHWAMPHVIFLASARQNDKTSGKKFENYPGSFIELKKMLRMGHSLFLTFLRSLGGSFKALMISDEALGTTDTLACLFWIVNCTVIRSPFQSCVALAMSSPTFLGD